MPIYLLTKATVTKLPSKTGSGLLGLEALGIQVGKSLFWPLGLPEHLLQLLRQLDGTCNLDLSADDASGSL